MIEHLYSIALTQKFVHYFCYFIFFLAVIHFCYLIAKANRVNKDMDSIRKHADRIEHNNVFHKDVEEEMGKDTVVSEIWRLYADQTLEKDAAVGLSNNVRFSNQSAHYYFNEDDYL